MRSKEISRKRDNTRDTVSLGTTSKVGIWGRTVRAKHARGQLGVGCTLKVCTPFRTGVVVISGALYVNGPEMMRMWEVADVIG